LLLLRLTLTADCSLGEKMHFWPPGANRAPSSPGSVALLE
jgi:hypothetical protein